MQPDDHPPAQVADREVNMVDAIQLALVDAMEQDSRVVVLGMDVGTLGGVFRTTRGLLAQFGPERVFDTPLAESAIIGASVGLAIGGMIPVPEIQFLGFTLQACHQMSQQVARFRARTGSRYSLPLTVRAPYGGGLRTPEFHADSLEGLYAQMPGIKVVCPAFPGDAYSMLTLAIRDPDPVLVVEPQRLYRSCIGKLSGDGAGIPIGVSRTVQTGTDVTLIAWSASVHLCLRAAEALGMLGISAAVLDLRSLVPLDVDGLVKAVQATGRAVVVHEAPLTGGFGAEVAATLHQDAFMALEAPVARVAAPDIPYPLGSLEDYYLPTVERVVSAARRTVEY